MTPAQCRSGRSARARRNRTPGCARTPGACGGAGVLNDVRAHADRVDSLRQLHDPKLGGHRVRRPITAIIGRVGDDRVSPATAVEAMVPPWPSSSANSSMTWRPARGYPSLRGARASWSTPDPARSGTQCPIPYHRGISLQSANGRSELDERLQTLDERGQPTGLQREDRPGTRPSLGSLIESSSRMKRGVPSGLRGSESIGGATSARRSSKKGRWGFCSFSRSRTVVTSCRVESALRGQVEDIVPNEHRRLLGVEERHIDSGAFLRRGALRGRVEAGSGSGASAGLEGPPTDGEAGPESTTRHPYLMLVSVRPTMRRMSWSSGSRPAQVEHDTHQFASGPS